MKITKKQQKLNRKKWIKALRSGKYKQGRQALCREDVSGNRYCCLGVLCDVFNIPFELKTMHMNGADRIYGPKNGSKDWAALSSPSIRNLVGLSNESGFFKNRNGTSETLANLNDSGFSFEKIADIIESEPEGLFK